MKRLIAAAVVAVLLATACDPNGTDSTNGSTTTDVTTTDVTTTDVTTTDTTEVAEPPVPDLPTDEYHCPVLSGYVAIAGGRAAAPSHFSTVGAAVPPAEVAALTDEQVDSEVSIRVLEEDDELQPGPGLESLTVLPIDTDDHPLEVAQQLREAGFDAAPIHLLGPTTHVTYVPGGSAVPLDQELEGPQTVASEPDMQLPPIGIVDTGFDMEIVSHAPWLHEPALDPDRDRETAGERLASGMSPFDQPAFHGTFITALVQQIAPSAPTVVASARPTDPSFVLAPAETGIEIKSGTVTSELEVVAALDRLITNAGPAGMDVPAVVNLSLGGYLCPGDDAYLALRTGLRAYLEAQPAAHFVAAAGNDGRESPRFYPAGFGTDDGACSDDPDRPKCPLIDAVTSVGGLDGEGKIAVFDDDPVYGTPRGSNHGDWVEKWAPAVDVVSVYDLDGAGQQTYGRAAWSGTSFAAPIYAAILWNHNFDSPSLPDEILRSDLGDVMFAVREGQGSCVAGPPGSKGDVIRVEPGDQMMC